jgi:hypothetical protein
MKYSDFEKGGKYSNTYPYPSKPTKPILPNKHTKEQVLQYADLLEMYEADLKNYKIQKELYYEKENEMLEIFKKDLFEELGIVGHKKAELLYSKAWEKGHSSGLYEVYLQASDLVDLID